MSLDAEPTVARHGSTDPGAPLVVLLHGRGSHEQEIIALAPRLPAGATYAAVRAPLAEGSGFAWFANRGIGRPVAESLSETMAWFRTWLDGVAPPGRPVILVGFSGGAAFAGGLVLSDPARYAGAAILFGTLPFDAGVPVGPSRLAGTPVFVAQGDADQVIPRELLERTWSYLLTESGAPVEAHRDPGGHAITAATVHRLAGWLRARLSPREHAAETTIVPMAPAEAAAHLREARAAGTLTDPFTDVDASLDESWGYQTQDVDRAQRLDAGETVIGAKLGLTSRAKQERMGVDRPIVGFLTRPMLVEPGDVATRLPSWVQPRIEPEIAFITARDLDRPLGIEDAPQYVESVLLAAEILDSRYRGYRFRLPDVVADNTSAAGVVVAAERHRLDDVPDLATLRCEVSIDGEVVHEATGAAILGAPLESLVLLSLHLDRHRQSLPAGSLVLAGALTDATPLEAGHRYDLSIERLGHLSIRG